ncbi:hypothetical protein [Nitrosovibrio tenuis]|uniref:Uncharacterized protein n=1 Tax=Nitrosovibrio tenuis TaxID=1233 RepID=A0A1H7P0W2_9PROT|nr:hypothetical protein [Nitrosovibrio tenuis]SEL29413.1 hypothetical protein SAMN05216387_10817 [Nitrosovibrio tenuis]
MNKSIVVFLASSCLLSACASIGLEEKTETYGAKFTGNHNTLARCVVNSLQSDSRWLIRGLQYDVRQYPGIEATEIYAYPSGSLPGTYARNSPENPDAVISYNPPVPVTHTFSPAANYSRKAAPGYSFLLTLKRTDNSTVVATLAGKRYEARIAWEKLKACSAD